MGSACCVAARDKSIVSAPGSEVLHHRNVRHYSPTWSFRWENRGRVAGEETSISWLSDGVSRNGGSDVKDESSTFVSEDGSPTESFSRRMLQKSPISEGATMHTRTPTSDQSISMNFSMDAISDQVKELAGSSSLSHPSPAKQSVSLPSALSQSPSPIYFKNRSPPANLTTSRWHSLINKGSEPQTPEFKSLSTFPVTLAMSAISSRGSCGDTSDGWSMQAFPEPEAASHKDNWPFDSESMNTNNEKSRSHGRVLTSSSVDLQGCGICTMLLTERSLWSSQKLIASNELPVVAVLICGHVYHAECLESMTPEISRYDPACPHCTLGAKQTLKLSQNAIEAELDSKARNNRLKNRVVDGDFDSDTFILDGLKGSGREGKGQKMTSSSSSTKGSSVKPFLRRHFSFGSNSQTARKRGLFWTRSMKA